MKFIPILLLLFSFSVFAYDNPYSNQKRWEAVERFENPQNFHDGRDAHYWEMKHDRYESERRNERELDDYTQKWLNM